MLRCFLQIRRNRHRARNHIEQDVPLRPQQHQRHRPRFHSAAASGSEIAKSPGTTPSPESKPPVAPAAARAAQTWVIRSPRPPARSTAPPIISARFTRRNVSPALRKKLEVCRAVKCASSRPAVNAVKPSAAPVTGRRNKRAILPALGLLRCVRSSPRHALLRSQTASSAIGHRMQERAVEPDQK